MHRATREEAEYKTEPRSFTAWLSALAVELTDKRRNKFNLTSCSFLRAEIVVFSQCNFQKSSVCEIREDTTQLV